MQTIEEKLIKFAENHNKWLKADFDAETRMFFDAATKSLDAKIFIASILSNLTGIEATLRYSVTPFNANGTLAEPGRSDLLSNKLLNAAKQKGYPVHLLRFNSETETEFNEKISKTGRDDYVKIVQLRHNMCHGNLYEFTREIKVLDHPIRQVDTAIIETTAFELQDIAKKWFFEYKKHKETIPDHTK